jgi:hypothetical protein
LIAIENIKIKNTLKPEILPEVKRRRGRKRTSLPHPFVPLPTASGVFISRQWLGGAIIPGEESGVMSCGAFSA